VDSSLDLRDQQMKDANVIVALFSSYSEADEALRELQARGLPCDDGQLYARATHRRTEARRLGPHPEMRARDRAEYAGHGEHLGVVSGARRFSGPNWQLATPDFAGGERHAKPRERTLLVARLTDTMPHDVATAVMCDHGALAVRDTAGRWRASLHKGDRDGEDCS